MKKKDESTGPRGGKTTVSKLGLRKKTFWLHPDEEEHLRRDAFEQRRPESELLREILRSHYEIES